MLLETDLPDDPDALRAMIIAAHSEIAARDVAISEREDRIAGLETAGTEAEAEIARLNAIIAAFQRHRFGTRSEQLDEDQLQLAFEELDAALGRVKASLDVAAKKAGTPRPRNTNRGSLPAHLERVEQVVDIAPARIVEAGLPTEALIAHVLVGKYADHLPLYRQAQIYARQGVQFDRSTLSDWVGRAAWWLAPLRDHLLTELKRSPKLFADETTAPVLDPGRGRTKTGQLWAYARDDRPWGGSDPPAVAYLYAPDRKAERPIEHLAGFQGTLQMDGYGGYPAAVA